MSGSQGLGGGVEKSRVWGNHQLIVDLFGVLIIACFSPCGDERGNGSGERRKGYGGWDETKPSRIATTIENEQQLLR